MPSELEGHRMADADNIEGIRFKKEVRDKKMPGQVRPLSAIPSLSLGF